METAQVSRGSSGKMTWASTLGIARRNSSESITHCCRYGVSGNATGCGKLEDAAKSRRCISISTIYLRVNILV